MKELRLKPVDTFFFRDHRDFAAGETSRASGLFPPRPGTVYGALRAAYIHAHGSIRGFAEGDIPDRVKKVCGTPEVPGEMRLKGCFLYSGNELMMPLPLDYNVKKAGDRSVGIPLFLVRDDIPGSGPATGYRLYSAEEEKTESAVGTFISLSAFKKQALRPATVMVWRSSDFLYEETKTGIALDHASRTARESMLYSLKMCRFNGSACLAVWVEGLDEPESLGYLRLGGRNRPWYVDKVLEANGIFSEDEEDEMLELIGKKGMARLVFLSPAVLSGASGYYRRSVMRFCLNELELPVIAEAIGRPVLVGGWDMVQNVPKPRYRAVPPGSVLYLRIDKNEARKLIKYLKQTMISDVLGYEGYGLAVLLPALNND